MASPEQVQQLTNTLAELQPQLQNQATQHAAQVAGLERRLAEGLANGARAPEAPRPPRSSQSAIDTRVLSRIGQ